MERRLPLVVILIIAVALASCQRNSLCINGDIQNLPDGAMRLSVMDTSMHWTPIDSFKVEKGHFEYDKGASLDGEECIILSTGNQNFVIFTGNAKITIKGNALRPEEIDVRGSESNDELLKFAKDLPGKERLAQIEAAFGSQISDREKNEKMVVELHDIEETQMKYIRDQIELQKTTPLGAFLLFNHINLFTTKELQYIHTSFASAHPSHKYAKLLNRLIKERIHREESEGRSYTETD